MIRSTFAGFTTAQLGMAASQRALDVTGQNIANINTVGYTRQRLDIASLNSKYGNFYNSENNIQPGFGVDMTGISQLRDPFLDMQYRSQMAILGTSDAHVATMEDLAPIFDETTMEGIKMALANITSSLDQFSQQVENQEFDSMVRSNMQILLNLFHENATRLEEVRNDAQQGFKDNDIKDLNLLLENIAELNKSIKNSNILGNPALELKDQRNNLLDELASYLPISVKYTDKQIGPGQTIEVLDVYFTDSTGQKFSLISDGDYGSFDTDISGQPVTLTINDARGTQSKDITDTIQSGTLKGTLDMLNKSGTFDNTDVNGIGYYEKALDSLVNTFAQKFNELNKAPVIDQNTGKPQVDAQGNAVLKDQPLFQTSDGSNTFTAKNIKIADGWQDGSYGLTASITPDANGNIASTDSSNILNMINAMKEDHEFFGPNNRKFFEGSFYDCFTGIENTLAIDTKANSTMLTNQITVLNQTANSRDSVSGVQLDEEGMNLMHYNQSYTAAARLMTTLDEALDTLINRTGVVGR